MYTAYFGLHGEPFSIAPDPRYLYMSERHREALAHLLYGVRAGGGFVVLSGEIGTGKTTVCRCLLEQVPADCDVAYVFNPKLTVPELLRTICEEFHLSVQPQGEQATIKECLDPLNAFLLNAHAQGRHSLLIIDEAQSLDATLLEQLRLLTNLETNERKLLQIVLIGQPELRDLLARPELEQVAQRIIARYHLGPLSEDETAHYIRHRMAVAGLSGPLPFDDAALKRLHRLSGGVPRRINLLCDRALLGAYATGLREIGVAVVDKAAREVFGDHITGTAPATSALGAPAASAPRWRGPAWLAAGMALGSALTAAVVWNLGGSLVPVGGPRQPASAAAPLPSAPSIPAPVPGATTPAASSPTDAGATATAAMTASTSAADAVSATAAATTVAASVPAAASPGASVSSPQTAAAPPVVAPSSGPYASIEPAWLELATAWGAKLDTSAPCESAGQAHLRCYTVRGLNLPTLRRLDRPGIVALRPADDPTAAPVHALVLKAGADFIVVHSGGQALKLEAADIERRWTGGYATLWSPPPEYDDTLVEGDKGPTVHWVASRLAKLQRKAPPATSGASDAVFDRGLKQQLQAFQRGQGLIPDGRAGPLTLMLLGRLSGDDTPRPATR